MFMLEQVKHRQNVNLTPIKKNKPGLGKDNIKKQCVILLKANGHSILNKMLRDKIPHWLNTKM